MGDRELSIGLMGSALGTGNLGVSALCLATIRGLVERLPGVRITLFDYVPGLRNVDLDIGETKHNVDLMGLALSKRFYQTSNIQQIRLAKNLGLHRLQPVLKRLHELDAVLDVSGGDSFTDLYGRWRERSIVLPKELVLDLGKKLVLTPQTYGPFKNPKCADAAREILAAATLCYARDARSHEIVKGLLGDRFDADRHKLGVDVAFNLPTRLPEPELCSTMESFAAKFDEVVGFNLSGLLVNTPGMDQHKFGFAQPYYPLALNTLRHALKGTNTGVVLIPHVNTGSGHYEDDATAARKIMAELSTQERSRVWLISSKSDLDCMQTKWLISRCDWFLGTRMHACIAALSSDVPTIAIAYSDKTKGVFETIGFDGFVADPREAGCEAHLVALVDQVRQSVPSLRANLTKANVAAQGVWAAQFDDIVREVSTG